MTGFSDGRQNTALIADPIDAITSNTAFDVQSIRFRYKARDSQVGRWILDGVSFQVHAGDVVGVVGPNGSGKTSLLKVLARVLTPQEGRVSLFGQDLASMIQQDVACVVGVVPQDTQQLFPFTVAETVLMGRFPHRPRGRWTGGLGWESRHDIAIAEQAMVTMDIGHVAHRVVTDLSGGERQRVLIARALAQTPQVLLLDEPTAFLDLQHQVEMCSLLRRLKESHGLTVVLVSHDLNLVGQYCDRILLVDNGQVVRQGCPEEVIEPDVLEAVYRCRVLVDQHPVSGLPRVTLPGRQLSGGT